MNDFSRDIGRLEARADSTDERLERIEAKLDKLVEELSGMSGGRKALVGLLTLAASLGAAVAEAMHWFRGGSI